jgi:hypothetical protein
VCSGLAEDLGEAGEGLLAQFDARQIPDADDLGGLAAHALDDDVLELFDVGKPAQRVDGELEGLVSRNRRATELSRSHFHILLPDRVLNVERGQAVVL